ncbi:MAG: phosphate ABC transporter permease subunit PstC [Pseudomonadota bacterium]
MTTFLNLGNAALVVAVIAIIGFFVGRARAVKSADGDPGVLHSLPKQHGWHTALSSFVPAFSVIILWAFLSGLAANIFASAIVPNDLDEIRLTQDERAELSEREIDVREDGRKTLFVANAQGLALALDRVIASAALTADEVATNPDSLADLLQAEGFPVFGAVSPTLLEIALRLRDFQNALAVIGPLLAIGLAVVGFLWALSRVKRDFRARLSVERWTMAFLIFASSVAILTTVAILAAVTVPSFTFFREYGLVQFLTGLTWAPAGDVVGVPEGRDGGYASQLGFLPLIWGTLYISVVALLVAVPLGLLAAIYLSEFASSRVRSWVKPALEILAGVPTIVYGIFALVTIGAFLRSVVGASTMPNTVSVVTAGVVMGMMLVPFVSSLSDDVINAVPQAMRDGSLGLGATPSETVIKVILPAALPGIVGAIVLAASRAIGETMIVVLAAGALSNVTGLETNPFGAVVTVTTRIVAVLTGEGSGFDSIDVVAIFALAFTLFFITLGLNLLAQRIVRKYREQYE